MPEQTRPTQAVQAVGIDLGTTYSVISHLNESGEPVTIPNQEGELATPSVVLFEGERPIVGTEALRNSIRFPDRVVENSKRFIGDVGKRWWINNIPYSPVDVATLILKKLVSAAQDKIGEISQAVITVPAQFSDAQRHATIQAGHAAGLERVDVINEPVAAALCYVLGSEGLWFSELAGEQRILVYDLGGGTFDLSLVRYRKDEVTVIASSGDLHLGGINWNAALVEAIAGQFAKAFRDDPRSNPESLQALALEVEQAKRGLSVRPRAALTCSHGGHRKTYQVELEQFQRLTKPLVDRTEEITLKLLKDNKLGWAHVDVVLVTGGASRMPMIRGRLKQLSGRTLNTALSPDLSIAHGATYYSGMLLSNDKFARSILSEEANKRLSKIKQQSVNARELGILIRDMETQKRVPHYLIPANTPLPASSTQQFGTVIPNQRRVHLVIVESGTSAEQPYVVLGDCRIDGLPPNLPEGSKIDVTISYDPEAKVHVSAKDAASGKSAHTEILRQENIVAQLTSDPRLSPDSAVLADVAAPKDVAAPNPFKKPAAASANAPGADLSSEKWEAFFDQTKPIPLCTTCGRPLDENGTCPRCAAVAQTPGGAAGARTPGGLKPKPAPTTAKPVAPAGRTANQAPPPLPKAAPPLPKPGVPRSTAGSASAPKPSAKPAASESAKTPPAPPPRKTPAPERPKRKPSAAPRDEGEDEFWKYVGE
ncbi:MAG TPA: Hsp70 family protein [Planctomycetaceae bacterium]|jgi:molecular chaperone DnaK|nr:Hsp70 family protein [Planctomycetaceae bacterium]